MNIWCLCSATWKYLNTNNSLTLFVYIIYIYICMYTYLFLGQLKLLPWATIVTISHIKLHIFVAFILKNCAAAFRAFVKQFSPCKVAAGAK